MLLDKKLLLSICASKLTLPEYDCTVTVPPNTSKLLFDVNVQLEIFRLVTSVSKAEAMSAEFSVNSQSVMICYPMPPDMSIVP